MQTMTHIYIADVIPVRRLSDKYGAGSGNIMLDDLDCSGREVDLFSCEENSQRTHDCTHEEDAGVKCGGKSCMKHKQQTYRLLL